MNAPSKVTKALPTISADHDIAVSPAEAMTAPSRGQSLAEIMTRTARDLAAVPEGPLAQRVK